MGFFDKLKKITTNLFSGFSEADEAFFEELEETLILADLGMDTALDAVEKLRTRVRKEKLQDQEAVKAALPGHSGGGDGRGRHGAGSLDPACCGAVHRRQRRRQDHVHRQTGLSAEKRGQAGPLLRGGHLPGRSGGPTADLGGAGRLRTCAPARGG